MTTTRTLFAAAALATSALFSTGAFAQEATPDTWTQLSAGQSRAAVLADVAMARSTGLDQAWDEGFIESLQTSADRAAVRQQTLQAIRSGELKAINAEVASLGLGANAG